MPSTVQIRAMQETDLSGCVDLCIKAYANHFFKLLEERHGQVGKRPWEVTERAGITAAFTKNMAQTFVATLDHETVGYILCYITRILEGRVGIGYLSNNAVDPRYHGRGIGKLLGRRVIDTFRQLDLDYARTTTSSQSCQAPARCVYQGLGYEACRKSVDWTLDLRRFSIRVYEPVELSSVTMRWARHDDLERILAIGLSYFDRLSLYARWQHHGLAPGCDWRDVQRESVEKAMNRWIQSTLVTEVDGEVVGYIAFDADEQTGVGTTNVLRGQGEDMALNNAIDPRYRGKGLEAYQLSHVLQLFRDQGMVVAVTRGLDDATRLQLGLTFDYTAWGFTPLRGYVDFFMKL